MVLVVPISTASMMMGSIAGLALSLVLLFPAIALGVKRLHDRDKPGSLIAVFIAPGLLVQAGQLLGITGGYQTVVGQSVYMPNTLGWVLNLVSLGVGIWALVTLGFLKGTIGANTYGPDPLVGGVREPALN